MTRLLFLLLTVTISVSMVSPIRAAESLALLDRVDHLDTLCREPMLAVHPGGALLVTGYGSQVTGTDWTVTPPLWRSDDGGRTWSSVDVGTSEDGAQGNSDVDLSVGPDGTAYFVAMGFNRETRAGTHMAMGVSADGGWGWRWHRLSESGFEDRPWVRVSSDGTAHAIWNDGKGVVHFASGDSGKSWSERARIATIGGSSHVATGPGGRIAVRISNISASGNQYDEDADAIAVSADNGMTWTQHPIPGNVEWDITFTDPNKIPRWVEPLAWGPDGTLYHLWSEGSTVFLGESSDLGANWRVHPVTTETGKAFFPYMTSGPGGALAATWFVQDGGSLTARLAVIRPAPDGAAPAVRMTEPFIPEAWNEDPENRVPTPAGEYLPVAFLRDGNLGVVSPIQDIHNDRWGFTFWKFAAE